MLPPTIGDGMLTQDMRQFADVLSFALPEPVEVDYTDVIASGGPTRIFSDKFGAPEIYFDSVPFYNFTVRFRLMRLHDFVLIDRIE